MSAGFRRLWIANLTSMMGFWMLLVSQKARALPEWLSAMVLGEANALMGSLTVKELLVRLVPELPRVEFLREPVWGGAWAATGIQ